VKVLKILLYNFIHALASSTYLHIVLNLRMRGAIPTLPHASMAWCLIKHNENFALHPSLGVSQDLNILLCVLLPNTLIVVIHVLVREKGIVIRRKINYY
jgi:hypothetical protein